MDTYHVVLFVHLMALFIGIGAGAVLVVCLINLRSAQTLQDALPWGVLSGKVEKAFPVAILGLFGSGAYMTSDVWSWSTGWIIVSIVGLVVLSLQGPLVGGRTGKKLEHALKSNGPGTLSAEARRMARHPGLWLTECTNLALVFGIVWNMTEKPGTATAIATLAIAYAVGIAVGYPLSRPEAARDAVTAPAG